MRVLFLALLLSGCGGDGNNNGSPDLVMLPDLSSLPDLTVGFPAPHPAMPQAVSAGGPVMKSPKFLAVSFPNDPLQASIDDFNMKIGPSKYWTGVTAEYGVGAGTALPPFHATDTLGKTITDSAIRAWLSTQIKSTPNFPQPDDNTLYAIYYPDTITISSPSGTSCKQFQGYHDDFAIASQKVTYTVIARCPPPVKSVTVLDNLTATASHEYLEAATDPLPSDNPAWNGIDDEHVAFAMLAGPELGDLCAAYPDSFYRPADLPYLVQRSWSNLAAAAGHDPCEPEGTSPYFNASPVLTDSFPVSPDGFTMVQAKGLSLAVGKSATIELDLYSDAPTSDVFQLSAFDVGAAFMGQQPTLDFAFDKDSGKNGDKVKLTITSLGDNSGGPTGATLFWIQSDLGMQSTVWLGLVANP
jgi:hypothetical protein